MQKLDKDVDYRKIPGLEGYYAGNDGSIWSIHGKHRKWLRKTKQRLDQSGDAIVSINTDKAYIKKVYRLILETFKTLPDEYYNVHINGDVKDNRLCNLLFGVENDKEEMNPNIKYVDVLGFPDYKVGEDGTVWTYKVKCYGSKRKWRKLSPSLDGYENKKSRKYFVYLTRDGEQVMKKVHRIVLESFIGPCPKGMEGCHNNGVSTDNRLVNLRWDTHINNEADKLIHDTHSRGDRNGNAKLTEEGARTIKQWLKNGEGTQADLARKLNVSPSTIGKIKSGKLWKWLEV